VAIASHRIASHRIASHRTASHRIASHRIASRINHAVVCYAVLKVSEAYLEPSLLRTHLDASLARTGLEYIDLYQLHWASRAALKTGKYPDRPVLEEVPLEATLAALDECRSAGKIRHIGVCNFGIEDLQRAVATGVPIASNQVCYHLLWRGIEDEVVAFCQAHNIAILPWSPMGQGLLTGKYATADDVPAGRQRTRLFSSARPQQRHGEVGLEAETFEALKKFNWIAAQLGEPVANVSLAWAREKPGVTSLLMGARNPDQLRRNLESLRLTLAPEVVGLLDDAGAEVKSKLGANLDPYEGADSTRIV
jgi:aryl-alcohol dehydrogenase-like predicted oxidoreductase